MPAPTDGEIAVVKLHYAVEDAYEKGYTEFDSLDLEDDEHLDLAPFHDSARYANIILPSLRAMAGYADGGHGTYQQHRQVATIKPGCEEDRPAEATLQPATTVFDTLVDAFQSGAHAGAHGEEKSPPEPPY